MNETEKKLSGVPETETVNGSFFAVEETGTEEAAEAAAKPARNGGNKKSRYSNEAVIVGQIAKVNAANSGKSTAVTVRTRVRGSVVTNYPTVVFFGEEAKKAAQFKIGDRVRIEGRLRSYDPEKLRPGQSPVLLVGEKIELNSNDEIEDDEGLRPLDQIDHQDVNTFEMRGQIVAVKDDRSDTSITIKTLAGDHLAIVEFPYLVRDKAEFFANLRVNSFVRALGTVQTANVVVNTVEKSKKDPEKETIIPRTKKRQFYVLLDITSA